MGIEGILEEVGFGCRCEENVEERMSVNVFVSSSMIEMYLKEGFKGLERMSIMEIFYYLEGSRFEFKSFRIFEEEMGVGVKKGGKLEGRKGGGMKRRWEEEGKDQARMSDILDADAEGKIGWDASLIGELLVEQKWEQLEKLVVSGKGRESGGKKGEIESNEETEEENDRQRRERKRRKGRVGSRKTFRGVCIAEATGFFQARTYRDRGERRREATYFVWGRGSGRLKLIGEDYERNSYGGTVTCVVLVINDMTEDWLDKSRKECRMWIFLGGCFDAHICDQLVRCVLDERDEDGCLEVCGAKAVEYFGVEEKKRGIRQRGRESGDSTSCRSKCRVILCFIRLSELSARTILGSTREVYESSVEDGGVIMVNICFNRGKESDGRRKGER
ncbi:hypothetical protein Tco_0653907 [Tanacetum coccineum]|uniref:Uncharacterized protein n=1 Tax=Tanacetum coccineum TaxID=301880 RepID=A0ABQ4X256_9ASTR